MSKLLETRNNNLETALLVGVLIRGGHEWQVRDTLDELAQLVKSAGAEVKGRILCKQNKISVGHYIGSGKAEEIADWIERNPVSMVIFDDDLTPVQGRNLERIFEVRVLDRTQLILDIFAQRAHTREGRLQIELAQHQYLLPRLRRMWTHLERQKGGIGLRGPGETQLEMDRRRIQLLIKSIRKELELVRTRRAEQRRGRRRHGWALVSLVGYTNAGKSTLLNRLSGARTFTANQLFATLDPTTRQVELPNHAPALLTDTVGFIRKLPHHLVDAFKATLEEVEEADLLLHVVDASHPQVDSQIEAVHQVLNELGADNKPMLYVLNKIDNEKGANAARRLQRTLPRAVAVSALTGEGFDRLLDVLADCLKRHKQILRLSVPVREGKLLSTLRKSASILEEKYEGNHALLLVRASPQLAALCRPFERNDSTESDV